tara:strand:+ start:7059 stop:7631 length:573 start_codon:yes stop_codon:yes gene_type:complete
MAYKDLKLKPSRNIAPHDIRSHLRAEFTGVAGDLVKVKTFDPDNDNYYAQGQSVGASHDGVYSNKFQSPWTVEKAVSGDFAGSILGITLEGTAVTDDHGNQIDGFNQRWADENGFVASGKPVQIATRGNFWVSNSCIAGNPQPGSGLAANNDGGFRVVLPGAAAANGTLVAKVLSSAGTRQGDVNIELTL